MPRRLIALLRGAVAFLGRIHRAWIYMRKLNYSRRLAWIKAAR